MLQALVLQVTSPVDWVRGQKLPCSSRGSLCRESRFAGFNGLAPVLAELYPEVLNVKWASGVDVPRGEEDVRKIQNDWSNLLPLQTSVCGMCLPTTRITRIRFRQILHVISQRGRNCNVMCRLQHPTNCSSSHVMFSSLYVLACRSHI